MKLTPANLQWKGWQPFTTGGQKFTGKSKFTESCIECVQANKKLNSLSKHGDLGKPPSVVEPNQEVE